MKVVVSPNKSSRGTPSNNNSNNKSAIHGALGIAPLPLR